MPQTIEEAGRLLSAGLISMERYAEVARRITGLPRVASIWEVSGEPSFDEVFPEITAKELDKTLLKKRHLTKPERDHYHKPNRDWVLTARGEVCKSTTILVVDDLLE